MRPMVFVHHMYCLGSVFPELIWISYVVYISENLEVELTMPFTIIQDEEGRDVMNLEGFQYEYDVKDGATFKLDNLYNGDEVASK